VLLYRVLVLSLPLLLALLGKVRLDHVQQR
jgi:hypothetical protein